MIVICNKKEQIHIINQLSCNCENCPVFDNCYKYASCDEALFNGIKWVIEERGDHNKTIRTSKE